MSSVLEIFKKYNKKIDVLDLELIISAVLKKPREFVLAHPEARVAPNHKLRIKNYVNRRIKGEPLAYILGEKEFYGLKFKVNKNTLIPRPETEMIIDYITHYMEHITWSTKQKIIFLDVGTGSGCIIITLVKLLKNLKINNKDFRFFAIDISKPALRIARQNAKLYKVDGRIGFFHGNLLEPIIDNIKNKKLIINNCKLIIAANLPYLTPKQIKNSPSIKYEPKLALEAGQDGLKYYRRLFKQIKKLKKICDTCYVLCEIDDSQDKRMKNMLKSYFPDLKVYLSDNSQKILKFIKIKKDLSGLDRIVIIKI